VEPLARISTALADVALASIAISGIVTTVLVAGVYWIDAADTPATRRRRPSRRLRGRANARVPLSGIVAGSSLVLGGLLALRFAIGRRTLGVIMALGAGVLNSRVAFELHKSVRDNRR
jgi:hypothetical protein